MRCSFYLYVCHTSYRGLEIIGDASRCFNCGSYNHSLKECPKPLDRVAVNNARKQHKTKRNQNPGSRLPTRYYQNSSGGKYDDLKPGVLGAETRQLLGLGVMWLFWFCFKTTFFFPGEFLNSPLFYWLIRFLEHIILLLFIVLEGVHVALKCRSIELISF